MRRLLLIFLIILMPLQWAWGAAASVCAHETGSNVSHFGHHPHKHEGAKANTDTEKADDSALGCHSDCGVCHGVGTAFAAVPNELPGPWATSVRFAPYEAVVLDRTLDTLLRPPSSLVS